MFASVNVAVVLLAAIDYISATNEMTRYHHRHNTKVMSALSTINSVVPSNVDLRLRSDRLGWAVTVMTEHVESAQSGSTHVLV